MTLGDALRRGAEYLGRRGIDTARLDAELLFAKALGLTRLDLYLHHDRPLTEGELAACRTLLERRGRREPAAYILGEWGFRRLTLKVDPRVLIPRPGTEVVVERCLELLRHLPEPDVLDVGTGSGAIALAIADEHQGARVTALDTSADALAVAAENAELTGLASRVRLERRDVAEGLEGAFDLVVSNPPYVEEDELPSLQPEVRDWEPRVALVGRGRETEAVAREARGVLRAGGWLVLEIGDGRGEEVAHILRSLRYEAVRYSPDLTGRDRVVEARWQ